LVLDFKLRTPSPPANSCHPQCSATQPAAPAACAAVRCGGCGKWWHVQRRPNPGGDRQPPPACAPPRAPRSRRTHTQVGARAKGHSGATASASAPPPFRVPRVAAQPCTGRKSPGAQAESASPRGQDPCARAAHGRRRVETRGARRARAGQLAIRNSHVASGTPRGNPPTERGLLSRTPAHSVRSTDPHLAPRAQVFPRPLPVAHAWSLVGLAHQGGHQ